MKKSIQTNPLKIVISASLLVCAFIPIFTLTSCATVSQWTLPLRTDGAEIFPNSIIPIGVNTHAHYYDPITTQNGNFDDNSFLPDSYISFSDRSNTSAGTQAFVYTSPEQHGTYDSGSSTQKHYPLGWYSYNNNNLSWATNNVIDSYANLYTQASTSSTSTIVSNLAGLYNSMLAFCAQSGILVNQYGDEWYQQLFASDNFHYNKNDIPDQAKINKQFYEFMFDINNLLTQSSNSLRFAQQALDFKYSSHMLASGPLLSTNWSKNVFAITKNVDDVDDPFWLTSNDLVDVPTIIGALNSNLNSAAGALDDFQDFALTRSSFVQSSDDNTKYVITPNSTFDLPVLLTPTNTSYTYYYPTKHLPYYSNDWYVQDTNTVTNYFKYHDAWKNFGNYVNGTNKYDNSTYVQNLTWDLPIDTFNTNLINATDYTPNPQVPLNSTSINNVLPINTGVDPAIKLLLDGGATDSYRSIITPQTFLAIANYTNYQYTYDDSGTKKICTVPIFAGFSGMYPIGLLWNDDATSIDKDLFIQRPAAALNIVNDKTNSENYSYWYFNNSALANKYNGFINWLQKPIPKNQKPTDINGTYLRIFQNLLNIYTFDITNNVWFNKDVTTSNKLFSPC